MDLLPIPLTRMLLFVSLIRHLQGYISLELPSSVNAPPTALPRDVANFVAQAVEVDVARVDCSWELWRYEIWQSDDGVVGLSKADRTELVSVFLKYGPAHNLGA
jgi:hypothetical protein